MQKKQEQQAKNLQAAKRQHKKDKADLRDTIRLTPGAKLTSSQKRRLAASIAKAKKDGRIPRTAQQTIPYQEMCRDGICIVSERYFTKQVQFYDINYQLAQNEDKNAIFENWCDFHPRPVLLPQPARRHGGAAPVYPYPRPERRL